MVTHEPDIAEHAERVIFLLDGLIARVQQNASDKLNGKKRGKLAVPRGAKQAISERPISDPESRIREQH
jgi:hypothetical protein